MTGTPNPRIVEHHTIRADTDLGQLARALLVLEAGLTLQGQGVINTHPTPDTAPTP